MATVTNMRHVHVYEHKDDVDIVTTACSASLSLLQSKKFLDCKKDGDNKGQVTLWGKFS